MVLATAHMVCLIPCSYVLVLTCEYSGSILFLNWHRPYVALFEVSISLGSYNLRCSLITYQQVLAPHIQAVVKTYDASEQATYQAKADALRLVYWDWAAVTAMPPIVLQPTITIITGTGYENVTNPFYSYKFQQFPFNTSLFPSSDFDGVLASYNETVRGLRSPGDGNDYDLSNSWLASPGFDITNRTVGAHALPPHRQP